MRRWWIEIRIWLNKLNNIIYDEIKCSDIKKEESKLLIIIISIMNKHVSNDWITDRIKGKLDCK